MASTLLVFILWVTALFFPSTPAGATVPSNAAVPYVDGLDALNDGRWRDAVAVLTKALDVAGDNPDILFARGVASTLAEDFPNALKDLQRAGRLGYPGREPELWTYVAEAMSGTVTVPDHALGGGPRGVPSGPVVVLLPGHLAQGHDDYTTEYGSFILYRLGQAYQDHRLPADKGGSGKSGGTKSPEMRQAMLKAGQLFAEKNYRRPEVAAISTSRATQASGDTITPKHMAHVARALAGNPADPQAHYQAGRAWLEAGRPAAARKEFTVALTFKTDLADAYLGRATAAARMGDEQRMTADLDIYKKLGGWFATRSARSTVEHELNEHKIKGSADRYLKELQEAAASDKPFERLVEIATQVHRAKGEHRLRYDELYQDRLRVLDEAVRDNPKNPDTLVALATYLVEEADIRGEKVEPRRALEPYRFQVSRNQELQRAIRIADQALGLDPKHVGAIMQKAIALTGLGDLGQADHLADQALTLSGNHADALALYARFRAMRANHMSNEAWNLRQERCTSSTHQETRDSIVYDVTITTCVPPSQADLQRAAQLDALAAELRRRARAAMEKAVGVTKGTVEGWLLQADLALWDGKIDQAQAAFEQAVKLNPKSLAAQQRLVQHYAQTGQQVKAEEQQLVFTGLFQTTAAPLLRLTWKNAERTAWQAARGYLVRAWQIDPQDARIAAYSGVVAEASGQAEEAAADYRMALALEEARLQLDEQKSETGRALGRDAMEFGLATQARFHLAKPLQKNGTFPEALAHYQAVLDYEKRMRLGFESREMFTALWPDQQPEGGALVVGPNNAATLIADAHLQTGKILSAMGKHDDSIEHFRAAAMLGPLKMAGMPQIGDGYGNTNFGGVAGVPAKEAQILLAKELIAKGDAEGAQAVLFEAGNGVPDHLRQQINDINMAILRLPPRPSHDSYADSEEEKTRLAELRTRQEQQVREQAERHAARQAQRERNLARRTLTGLPLLATVVPSLVGRWEMIPDNPSTPKRLLTIGPDSRYTLVASNDNSTIRGTAYLQNKQRGGRRGKSEPSSGQIMLYDDQSGQVGSMWFEMTGDDVMQLTGASGTKYATKRQR
ncbi:MAG: tetratricopeptide repeat protein [Nitrospiraceae bacterium]